MILLEILEWILGLLLFLFIFTQILVPMWRNTPYCPIFRKKARALEAQLGEAKGKVEEAEFKGNIKRERHRAERLRGR